MTDTFITSFIKIKNNQVFINGLTYFEENKEIDFSSFIRELYKKMDMNYPKFYKMDDLSKLALLGAELLIKQSANSYLPNEKSILLSNKSASLDTDYKHQEAIHNGLASPAIFVYTLPNICIGEIAIKHKIMGENTFFVNECFDEKTLFNHTNILFQTAKTKWSICGWVEFFQNNYELFLYSVEQKPQFDVSPIKNLPIFASLLLKEDQLIHHPKNIELLYK